MKPTTTAPAGSTLGRCIRSQFDTPPHEPWEGTLAEWLDANDEGALDHTHEEIMRILISEGIYQGGGGAAPAYTLTLL